MADSIDAFVIDLDDDDLRMRRLGSSQLKAKIEKAQLLRVEKMEDITQRNQEDKTKNKAKGNSFQILKREANYCLLLPLLLRKSFQG